MADDLDLDLDLEGQDIEKKVDRYQKRYKDLSSKVELTTKERDEQTKLNETLTSEKDAALKERDFYASFADSMAQYPQAKDFKDKIKEKVMVGYTIEDATVSVLSKEGRLTGAAPESRPSPAGGSATTTPPQSGKKPIGEMTREEKRQALIEAEGKGDISIS